MSLFQPDQGAVPSNIEFFALLSQRDLALEIPINYVPAAGIVLRPACFPSGVFDIDRASKCFANLFASRFRRIDVDVFWDASSAVWSLCPVEITSQQSSPGSQTSSSLTTVPSQTSSPTLSRTTLTNAAVMSVDPTPIRVRQPTDGATGSSRDDRQDTDRFTAGPYSCSRDLGFSYFTQTLAAYLQATETDLNASMSYLIINVHAAASPSAPSSPAQMPLPAQLPDQGSFLSTLLRQNLSSYLYSPAELQTQRLNLNATGSWYAPGASYVPDSSFLNISVQNDIASSPDGWPGEGFVELFNAKRLLVGFGQIDPQMSGYNFEADQDYIFGAGYIQQISSAELNSTSTTMPERCFFDSTNTSVASQNSSWAVTGVNGSSSSDSLTKAANLMACGITPILNQTLDGKSADQDFAPYAEFAFNTTIWSWSAGEPLDQNESGQGQHCAALNVSSGRWHARPCGEGHYGACRRSDQPYAWEVSQSSQSYTYINQACSPDATFGVPRTALENRHLVSHWQDWITKQDDGDPDRLLWLNLNDLDTSTCWVYGETGTCPYAARNSEGDRKIAVPVVAAIIIFIIAGLTVFVKCAANRRSSKRRRRRGDDGWDYEGVPL